MRPVRILATQAIAAAIVLALCRVQARSAVRALVQGESVSTLWWHFWRHWYPHLFFLFCFEQLAHLMTLFTPTLAGSQVNRVRLLVDRSSSLRLAGAVCNDSTE